MQRRSLLILIIAALAVIALPLPAEAIAGCWEDTDRDGPPERQKADITSVCVDWSDTFTAIVYARDVASPDDAAQFGDVAVGVNFGDPEFPPLTAELRIISGRAEAEVTETDYNFDEDFNVQTRTRCAIPYAYDGTAYRLGPFPGDCLGDFEELTFTASITHSNDGFNNDRVGDYFPIGYPEVATVDRHSTRPVSRIAGASRFATAAAISRTAFQASTTAYLARADDFADAVTGGALTDGPILLVPSCGEPPQDVVAELDRLGVEEVVALGGESAVCEDLLQRLGAGRRTARLSGESRFDTAAAIAQRAFPETAEEVYIARADNPVDAVAGGVLTRGPVLLTPTCGEPPQALLDAVERLDPQRVVALGGLAAVCDEVLTRVAQGRDIARLAGSGRAATSAAIATHEGFSGGVLFVAREDEVADAVAGGVLPGAPILLAPSCGPAAVEVESYARNLAPEQVVALGGSSALCDFTLNYIASAIDG